MSLFISFEGGEGSGKTTQAKLLHDRLVAGGHLTLAVREPGGTELGEYLRTWLKATRKPMTPAAELFLFTAARSEVVRRVIRPALESGAMVIADRYADSTTAYQGYGRRLPLRSVHSANKLATDGLWPHLTMFLDMPPEAALRRTPEGADRRFEDEDLQFHRRVRDGYLKLAARGPQRWAIIDASQSTEAVADRVWERVSPLLPAESSVRASVQPPGSPGART